MTQHFLGLLFLQLDKVEALVLFWSNVIFGSPDFHNKQQRFRITIIINSQTFKKTSRMNENNRGNVTPRRILYFWQGTWASPYLVIFEFSTSSSVKFWIAALKSQNHDAIDWNKNFCWVQKSNSFCKDESKSSGSKIQRTRQRCL